MGMGEERVVGEKSDADSIHSFASSSTLTPAPTSPIDEDDKPSFLLEQDSEPGLCATPLRFHLNLYHGGKLHSHFEAIQHSSSVSFSRFLIPLLHSFLLHHDPLKPPRRPHTTSYLDGFRGVAALIFLHSHFLKNWFSPLRSGYLSSPENQYIMQLPILLPLLRSRAHVAIFFVISGFVLSYKPL
jgi:hypothetical protein